MFKQAKRTATFLRIAIDGPAGSGKTYTALRFAHQIAKPPTGKIAVIDTERGSSQKYEGKEIDGYTWKFDVAELNTFEPDRYTEAIEFAAKARYAVLVIDSLSHAWAGKGGSLEQKDKAGGSWTAWRNVTPMHERMVDTILQAPMHIITTMRSKMDYVQELNSDGKWEVRRLGMAPVQRAGTEYEFDLVVDMDNSHTLRVSKTRFESVDGLVVAKPGFAFIDRVLAELGGEPTKPELTLDNLLAQGITFDEIIEASDGQIPATPEEFERVAIVLGLPV